jgi:hypothetical protein
LKSNSDKDEDEDGYEPKKKGKRAIGNDEVILLH